MGLKLKQTNYHIKVEAFVTNSEQVTERKRISRF